eukprot:2330941-Ditylum_brightwellii.AAC.1
MQKPLEKRIACAIKEHGDLDNQKPKLRHKRRKWEMHFASAKQTAWGQAKKKCDYHGLCYHDTSKCDLTKSHKKHVQPTHRITEQQRLRQVWFVKDAKRRAKRRSLTVQEVKDLN